MTEWTTCADLASEGADLDELRRAIERGLVHAVPSPVETFGGFVINLESYQQWRAGQPVRVEPIARPQRPERAKSAPVEVIYPPGTVSNAEAERLTGRRTQSLVEAGVTYEVIRDVHGKGRYRAWSLASIKEYLARRARGERRARKDRDGLLTLMEAAALAGCSEHVLRRADDALTPERVGNRRRYRREVVLQWAERRRAS